MTGQYGAHEVMELHEVLTDVINGINQFELYRPHVTDQQLSSILEKQINFMAQEYNDMTRTLSQKGFSQPQPYQPQISGQPVYGLDNPKTQSPITSARRLNDRDISSGMLGCLKSSVILKSMASLECADLNLRRMVQQGSINCSEMAYEVWQYMNQKGYYQIPTMKQMTTETMINTYVPANMRNINNMQNNLGSNNFMNNMSNNLNTLNNMNNMNDMNNLSNYNYTMSNSDNMNNINNMNNNNTNFLNTINSMPMGTLQ